MEEVTTLFVVTRNTLYKFEIEGEKHPERIRICKFWSDRGVWMEWHVVDIWDNEANMLIGWVELLGNLRVRFRGLAPIQTSPVLAYCLDEEEAIAVLTNPTSASKRREISRQTARTITLGHPVFRMSES